MKCADVYDVFFEPGEVVEIRAYGLSRSNKAWEGWAGGAGIVYGYFDNAEDFGKCAEALENAKAPGIYFTLNPVIPDLLARSANRLKASGAKTVTTSDKDIKCIRWLPIDLDPIRPTGISSTDDELKAAIKLRKKIWQWIKKQDWALKKNVVKYCLPAVSGNGAHLLCQFDDLPNKVDNVQLVQQALAAIAKEFNNGKVDVDQAVFNPARIWKLYGTTARKGDHTKGRPHRRSYIEPKFLASLKK